MKQTLEWFSDQQVFLSEKQHESINTNGYQEQKCVLTLNSPADV